MDRLRKSIERSRRDRRVTEMIKVENLTKRFGSIYALNDVSFEIGEGEIVGLLGPNGAGKSTAMNIITGYLSTTSGKVLVGGIDMLENPIEAKKQIGFLPEQPPLYPDMTVMEFLNFVYDLKGCELEREAHLEEIISVTKISEVRGRLIKNLSKGNKQRVGIAQALIGDPKVVIFDEPTVGLDPKQILAVRNLLRTLAKRHTVILSTHILAEVQAVCERIVVIDRGRVIADERTEELSRAVSDNARYRYRILGPGRDIVAALRTRPGIARAELLPEREGDAVSVLVDFDRGVDARRTVFNLCASSSWPIVGLSPVGADIEDIFLRLLEQEKRETR